MKCPHCLKEMIMAPRVFANVEAYGNSTIGATECCNKPVRVRRIIAFDISIPYKYKEIKEDDWGVEFKYKKD